MPDKKTKKKARPKKNKDSSRFFSARFHKTAVITLGCLLIAAAASFFYLRSIINRKIKEDVRTAETLHGEGRLEEALSLLESAIARRPSLYEKTPVRFIMADAMYNASDKDKAFDIWNEIVSSEPGGRYYPSSLLRLASIAKEEGDVSGAAVMLEEITGNFPDSTALPEAHYKLAGCYREMRRWDGALENYETVIESFPGSEIAGKTGEALGELNTFLIHSPIVTSRDIAYQVRPGDTLEQIARRHNTTVELIMKANDLSGPIIPVGKRLKITPANFDILVCADENILTLRLNGRFFKQYTVGTGEFGKTPLGDFKITNKMVHPVWYAEDGVYPYGHPKNILGTRWLGLDLRGYGIHGTTEPESIGKHETAGCVRMLNEDVEELYDLVIPGTPVAITGTSSSNAW